MGSSRLYGCSGQWWDGGFGEPGWDPKTSVPVSKRRSSPPVPHMSGNWSSASWPVRSSSVVSKGKGLKPLDDFILQRSEPCFTHGDISVTGQGFPEAA